MIDRISRWTTSYRAKLAFSYLAVIAVFAVAWAWSLFGPLTAAVVEQQEDHLLAVAQAGSIALAESDAPAADVTERLVAQTHLRMTLIDANGVVLVDTEESPSAMENHAGRPEVAAALDGGMGTDRRVSATQGTERIYLAIPASYKGEPVILRVSSSLAGVNAVASQARRTGLALLALALMVAAIVVVRLTAVATKPIIRLTDSAQRMAAGDLRSDVPMETGDLQTLSVALTDLQMQMQHRLEDLEAEKDNLSAVLNGLTDAVFLLHDTEIRFANKAADIFFASPRGGWRGKEYVNLGLPASVTGLIGSYEEDIRSKIEDVGPDTSGRYLRVTVLHLNPTEQHTRTLVVIADITERTRVDHVRRDFVANASHELKTPVAGIHLLAESVADAASEKDVEQALAFTEQIATESGRLSRLVQDLLDLSRLEAATISGVISDLREAVVNTLAGHRVAARDRGLDLTFDDTSAPGEDAYVKADPTDLAVALDNLLDNAIKYTEKGSVAVSLSVSSDSVMLDVTDTGIGIPAEDLGRIFERFYRVDRARSRDSGGTGLGLSLVRHVIERANGSIEVSSTPGSGTTFRMTLTRA